MLTLAWLLGTVAVATAVIWKGSLYLEGAADELALYYGLPATVQGALIAAAGSSFPELASVVIATFPEPIGHGDFELGVAGVVGSAVFNILVIPALSALATREPLESTPALVYREAQFYIIAVATLLLTFSLAVIYYPAGGVGTIEGEVTRALAAGPLALYVLYLFIQYQETGDYEAEEPPDGSSPARQWGLLAAGLVLILIGVELLVDSADQLGAYFGTPSFLWGLTIIAAGTSLPDAIISVRAARSGDSSVSLANVLGSNTFDLLVAVPVGVMLAGATVIQFGVAAPMMAFLVVATIALFTAARTDFELSDAEAWVLLALYAAFVGWMLLESVGATSVVR